jgi:uncharacterized protein (DUF1697 family)
MASFVALLRGVNVGGNRSVKMSDLRAMFAAAGCTDVTTYIQSGNVVFAHTERSSAPLQAELERRLNESTGMSIAVTLRTAREWHAVVTGNPYPGVEGAKLHVIFLDQKLPASALDSIDLEACAPESLVLHGREIYLHLPNGIGRAKLPPALAKLPSARGPHKSTATVRNWNTVLKLDDLVSSLG